MLDQIFGYLPRADLHTCTLVCRWWSARSSLYFLRKAGVISKAKLFFIQTGLQHFRTAAISSSRIICSVRELCLQGTLELPALQGVIRELRCLRTLELKKARFSSVKRRPPITATSQTQLQILRLSDVDPPRSDSSSSTSSWNVLSLFSSIGMLCLSGIYPNGLDNVGFLKGIVFNAPKTRIHALSMKSDLLPFAESVFTLAMDFGSLKRLNLASLSILRHTHALAEFLVAHNNQLTGLYLQTTLGEFVQDIQMDAQGKPAARSPMS